MSNLITGNALYDGWHHVIIDRDGAAGDNAGDGVWWCANKIGKYVSSVWTEVEIDNGVLSISILPARGVNVDGKWDLFGIVGAPDIMCFIFKNVNDAIEFKLRFG